MGFELDYIFHPQSVAIAGASESPDKQGHNYFKNLLEDFDGPVYPINIRAESVLGQKTYKSIRDLPTDVDYVISAIPNRDILDLVDACAEKKVKTLHLFTARFSETGYEKEAELERELLARARKYGIRIIGPNCMGIYYPKVGISFMSGFPKIPGNVGIISQSGGNASEIIQLGASRGIHFSKLVSYGNALDLNEADLIEYLADDPDTDIIGGYIEGVRDGARLVKVLREANKKKPVVLLKGGRTDAGTSMVSSHTASLAGQREVWESMCRQTGTTNVYSMDELIDAIVAFRFMPPATGSNVLVGGGSGGRSVTSADECEEEGLTCAAIPAEVHTELSERDSFFGPWVNNPIDGSIMGGSNLRAENVLEIIAKNPAYDVVINSIGSMGPWMGGTTDPNAKPEEEDPRTRRGRRMLERTLEVCGRLEKPLALVIGDYLPSDQRQLESAQELRRQVMESGFAIFPSIRRASRAIHRLSTYYTRRDKL